MSDEEFVRRKSKMIVPDIERVILVERGKPYDGITKYALGIVSPGLESLGWQHFIGRRTILLLQDGEVDD